ncbi:MAG TPA: hypothetical protein VLU92_10960, partial [Candidatus Dormibacteraeota bacterium]|nr:hypothetical protein [Candidatus Dormibacteraeota bacterium]
AIPAATGTISYTFYSNNTCAGPGTAAGSLFALGSKSNTESNLVLGAYSFKATYSGDSHYNSKVSDCEPFTVTAAPPPTKVNVNLSTIVFDAATNKALDDLKLSAGGSVYDTSRVVTPSAIPAATGTISYTFYSNNTCAGPGTAAGSLFALGSKSNTEATLVLGAYSFKATYSGDSHYNSKVSDCEPFAVTEGSAPTKDETSVTTQSSEIGSAVAPGASVTDTATVTNKTSGGATPTGTVQFKLSFNDGAATNVGSPVTLDSTGKATSAAVSGTTTPGDTAPGTYCWQAFFTATGNFNNSSGTAKTNECFTVATGGVEGATATATPTGGVLADTGANTPDQSFGLVLAALGLLAMVGGAFAWRRREA